MSRVDWSVPALRVFLVTLFAFLLLMQGMSLPGQFAPWSVQAPERATVAWVMLAAAELGALCLQIVIVCTWRLLTTVRAGRIFSGASMSLVDVVVWTFVAGWLLVLATAAGLAGYLYFTPELRDPGLPILLFGVVLVGAVLVLLVVILRALLRQATALQSEMEQVI